MSLPESLLPNRLSNLLEFVDLDVPQEPRIPPEQKENFKTLIADLQTSVDQSPSQESLIQLKTTVQESLADQRLDVEEVQAIATIDLSAGARHPGSGDRAPFQDGFKHHSYPNDENPRPISRSAGPSGSSLDAALPTSGQITWHSIWLSERSLLNDVVHASGDSTTTQLILLNHFNHPRKTHKTRSLISRSNS